MKTLTTITLLFLLISCSKSDSVEEEQIEECPCETVNFFDTDGRFLTEELKLCQLDDSYELEDQGYTSLVITNKNYQQLRDKSLTQGCSAPIFRD